MNDLELMRHAKDYIDQMANGIDPLTGERADEDDMINNVRISRCLFYVSDVLRQVIENGGTVGGQNGQSYRGGRERRRRSEFYITNEQRRILAPSERYVNVSDMANEINRVTAENNTKKFSASWINNWLVSIEMLEIVDGQKRATEQGGEIGITSEERFSQNGVRYFSTTYSPGAQGFIYDNIDAIIAFKYSGTDLP